MAKRFTIDILLNLLTEGADTFANLEKQAKNLAKSTKKAEAETKSSLEAIAKRSAIASNSLNGLSKSASNVVNDLEAMRKAAPNAIINTVSIENTIIQMNDVLKILRKTRDELKKTGQVDLAVNVKEQIKNIEDGRSELKKYRKEIDSVNATEIAPKVNTNINREISDTTVNVTKLINSIDSLKNKLSKSDKQSIIDTSNIPNDVKLVEQLEQQLSSAKREFDTLGKNKDKTTEKNLNDLIKIVGNYKTELTSLENRIKSLNENEIKPNIKVNVAEGLREVNKEIRSIKTNIDSATKNGSLLSDTPTLLLGIDKAVARLDELRNSAASIGQNTQAIDNAEKRLLSYAAAVDKTDRELEKLDNSAKSGRLNNLLNVEEQKAELKKLEIELATILKQLAELKEKGKDIQIVTTLKKRAEDTQGKIADFSASGVDKSLEPRIARTVVAAKNAVGTIKGIEDSLPKSSIGKVFKDIGERMRGILSVAGSQNSVIKSFSTGLRLMGTTAFVAGGQLRTAGFAFTALASIMQNFAPVLLNVLRTAGPFAPWIAAIGVAAIGVAAQIAGFATALGLIISEGIKFNSALEVAKNNLSGLINEFFTVKKESGIAGQFVEIADAAERFKAGQEIASEALNLLQTDALNTNFTFEQLLKPFEAVITSLGSANTTLVDAEKLAIGFARAGTLVSYNAERITTSISEILSGSGRKTNAIVRLLSNITDSQGIRLTTQRIRELRASNPVQLTEELRNALDRVTAEAAKANTKTLPGLISNFKELYQIFSGKVTAVGLDILEKTLDKVYKKFISFKEDAKGTTIGFNLTEGAEKLLNIFTLLATKVLDDVSKILVKIADYILSLGEYFSKNSVEIEHIYNLLISIAKSIGLLIYDTLKIFGIVGNTSDDFTIMKVTLGLIAGIVGVIRLGIIGISSAVDGVLYTVNGLFLLILKGLKEIVEVAPLPQKFKDFLLPGLDSQIDKRKSQMKKYKDNLADNAKEIYDILNPKNENISDGKKKESTDKYKLFPDNAPNDIEKVGKSIIKSFIAYYDELIALAKSRNQILIDETKKRIDSELNIIQTQGELGLKAQSEINDKEAELEKQRIAVQKTALIQEEANLKARLNLKNPASINNAYRQEVERLKAEYAQKPVKEGESNVEELNSKLEDLNNKRNKELLKTQLEIEQIESKKRLLEASIPEIDFNLAKKEYDRVALLRKDLISLRESVFSKTGGTSTQEGEDNFIAKAVSEITDEYKKNLIQIKANENELTKLSTLFKTSSSEEKSIIANKLELLDLENEDYKKKNELLIQNIALDIELRRIQNINDNVSRLQSGLSREENQINRDVTRGLISQQDALVKLTTIRRDYKSALQEQLLALEETSKTRVLDIAEIERVRTLKQEIESLNTTVTESVLLNINQEVGNGLIDFFTKIQESIGNTKSAIQDLGKTFLNAFRKTISQQIVQQFFAPILGQLGQTEGKAQGFLASFLRNLGVEPAVKQNAKINAGAVDKTQRDEKGNPINVGGLDLTQKQPIEDIGLIIKNVKTITQARIDEEDKFLGAFNLSVGKVTTSLETLGKVVGDLYTATIDATNFIKTNGGEINGKIAKSLNFVPKGSGFNFKSQLGNITSSGNQRIDNAIISAGKANGIDPAFLFTIAKKESRFKLDAYNKKSGARGLFQFLEGTAADFGVTDRNNPEQSANGAAKYLKYLLKLFNGDVVLAAEAYNYGQGNLQKYLQGKKGLPAETRDYGNFVKNNYTGTGYLTKGSVTAKNPIVNAVDNANESFKGALQALAESPKISNILAKLDIAVDIAKIKSAGSVEGFFPDIERRVAEAQALEGKSIDTTSQLTNQNAALQQAIENLDKTIASQPAPISLGSSSNSTGSPSKLETISTLVSSIFSAFSTKKASGGFISGKGSSVQDAVPAMLSNGEYVVSAEKVKKYGKKFFDKINNGFASGGFVVPDASKYNFLGGGAKLNELPKAIEYVAPAVKKKSKFKSILGKILSIAAPFLNLIPGVGPFLSIAAGAAGGALSGTDLKSSILGGIFGGVAGLGGLSGSGGALGSIGKFFTNGTVKNLVGVFGNALGNDTGQLNFLGNSIFEKYFSKYIPKKAGGGFISKLFGGGGLLSSIFGGGLFGRGEGSGSFGGNKLSSIFSILGGGGFGGDDFISNLFPLMSLITGGEGFGLFGLLLNLFKKNKKAGGGIISSIGGLFSKLFGGGKTNIGGLPFFGNDPQKLISLANIGGNGGTAGKGLSGILGGLFNDKNSGGLLGLFSLFGGGLFGGGSQSKPPNDFDSVNPSGYLGSADPDYIRKNLLGSAYNFQSDAGYISKFNYTKEIQDFIDSVYETSSLTGAAEAVKQQGSGILGGLGGILTTILGLLSLNKKGSGTASPTGSVVSSVANAVVGNSSSKGLSNIFSNLAGLFKGLFGRANGGHVIGAGSSISDSIPAMLSNGEYVVKASAVRNIGVNTLDYINEGRVKLAAGGLVGSGIDTIGGNTNSKMNIDNSLKIVNVLDANLVSDHLNSSDGRRTLVNVISSNKTMIKSALGL